MYRITFSATLPYGQPGPTGVGVGQGTRPYVWFRLINLKTGATSRREFGLLDSGCDVSLLDYGILTSICSMPGSSLPEREVRIGVAGGGSIDAYEVQNVAIEVEGTMVSGLRVPLLFGTAAMPLIGRQVYLNTFDLAFTPTAWFHA